MAQYVDKSYLNTGYVPTTTTNNSGNNLSNTQALYNQFAAQNEAARQSQLEALAQRLAYSKNLYNSQIDDVNSQYQSLINQSEVNRYKGARALRESLANRGQLDSGLGRQESLYLDSTYGNQVSNLQAQRQQQINNLKNLIIQLEADAAADKATINETYANNLKNYSV